MSMTFSYSILWAKSGLTKIVGGGTLYYIYIYFRPMCGHFDLTYFQDLLQCHQNKKT